MDRSNDSNSSGVRLMYFSGCLRVNPLVAYPYLALLNNVSQAWAMYCLIIFYRATYQELAPIRPFYKFCTVKAVVFLSFWQGQTLLFMVKMQWIKVSQRETKTDYDAAEVATAMQEFLICVEMFFAAIAHSYAFPPSEYFGKFIFVQFYLFSDCLLIWTLYSQALRFRRKGV